MALMTFILGTMLCGTFASAASGGPIGYHGCIPEESGWHFGVEVETSRTGGVSQRIVNNVWLPIPYYVSEKETCFPSSEEKTSLVYQTEKTNESACEILKRKSMEICQTEGLSNNYECHAKIMEDLIGSLKAKLDIHCSF